MILLFRRNKLVPLAKSQANKALLLIAFGVLSGSFCDKLWIPDLRSVCLAGDGASP